MNSPQFSQMTERTYSELPEMVREADALHDYALKRYLSAICDVQDQVDKLVARFTYLDLSDRMLLDSLIDEYNYYDLDYSYFQTSSSKQSGRLAVADGTTAHLRTVETYRIVPDTTIYAGAMARTDNMNTGISYGVRVWFYNPNMELINTRDVAVKVGTAGPQWVALNGMVMAPAEAYYARISGFVKNNTGIDATIWFDDVYLRSNYEISMTSNLVSGGHNYELRAETEMVKQGDFDDAWTMDDLSEWTITDDVTMAEKSLSGAPAAQEYRNWIELVSTDANAPSIRQNVADVVPGATYTASMLVLRTDSTTSDNLLRLTITPNTGGPTVFERRLDAYPINSPVLVPFTWNAPEFVSSAILTIEHIDAADGPVSALFVNDVSMIRFNPNASQLSRYGSPVTKEVQELTRVEMLGDRNINGDHWISYETGGSPEEPIAPTVDGPLSYVESSWHPSKPGNSYRFRAEMWANSPEAYYDMIMFYQIDGKGWGEMSLDRLAPSAPNMWVMVEQTFQLPEGADSFRLNLDRYNMNGNINIRNVSMTAETDRSWYSAGSRPFAFNALASRAISFLNAGDLLSYTAKVEYTGDPAPGRYGMRVYSGDSQIVHESLVDFDNTSDFTNITGAFQVPQSLMELRFVFYVNSPTPFHQAAFFIRDIEVNHSRQNYVEDAGNVVVNCGFENPEAPLTNWQVYLESRQLRRNYIRNSIGPGATSTENWSARGDDVLDLVQKDGRPAMRLTYNGEAGTGIDWAKVQSQDGHYAPSTSDSPQITVEVKVDQLVRDMSLSVGASGDMAVQSLYPLVSQRPEDGWVKHTIPLKVNASNPSSGEMYIDFTMDKQGSEVGDTFYYRNIMLEYRPLPGGFFDKDSRDTALAEYSYIPGTDSANSRYTEERRLTYRTPNIMDNIMVGIGLGYNVEDVPNRPDDRPLGTTSDLVDPRTANTEWLPWLMQFAGTDIGIFSTNEEAREALSNITGNFSDGTISAISAAVQSVLTNTKTVRIFPHTTDMTQIGQATQWDLSIVTRTSETPDLSVIERAVIERDAKPAGVVLHFHRHQSTWDAVELANPTWNVWDTRDWTALEESGLGS